MNFSDQFRSDHLPVDPLKRRQMRQDLREAHAYVTAELNRARDPQRIWNLTQERKRLAAIFERLA